MTTGKRPVEHFTCKACGKDVLIEHHGEKQGFTSYHAIPECPSWKKLIAEMKPEKESIVAIAYTVEKPN